MNYTVYNKNGETFWQSPVIETPEASGITEYLDVRDLPQWDLQTQKLKLEVTGTTKSVAVVPLDSAELVALAKTAKLTELADYDKSTAVNSFKLNGSDTWLDKAARADFTMSLEAYKADGDTTTPFIIPAALLIPLLM